MDIRDFEIYCINLNERPDRWEESQFEFEKIGLFPLRFPARKHDNPVTGCSLSHFMVLYECQLKGRHAMIFEDDVHFINNYEQINKYLNTAPEWDMLYFGANICGQIIGIDERWGKLSHAQSTHSYCVNINFIDKVLEKIEHSWGKPLDLIYTEDIIPYNNCYITIPMLAIQRPSYSDIERKVMNYNWMEQRYYDNLRKA